MKLTKEQAKKNLVDLVAKYERELNSDKIKDYNEEATKTGFIMPLLKDVLGWDVNNRDEVSPEESVSRDRVDYGLKIDGRVKIYVEAKTPTDGLINHVEQALRYGYSNNKNGPPFVLLTNFTETWCFDVTLRVNPKKPSSGRKIDLRWEHYLEDHYFNELWLLSKESALNGELDKLLLKKSKEERISVDKSILENLKQWRESLAKDIYKNNPKLFNSDDREKDAHFLKEITQKLLDRIVFIRFCEDRNLMHRKTLNDIFAERTDTVGTKTMLFLNEEFKAYERNFDSDLFEHKEWENDLAIDWLVMEKIIEDAYNNPYKFDAIPLDVLGNIYEQYLGDTIRLTDSQVKYEMKPDVRKAGGVYYTPEYIVDYIVKNTIGKLLSELSPNKIKELKILDPACGSGSFLIKAYDEMIRYYQGQKEKPLTVNEKKDILIRHIYGVDLDEQAVEVTKLSLMLKMLQGEHGLVSAHALLPMLDANIKCGNSLISGDAVELKKYFGDDWYKVKPFNWDKSFSSIIKDGGFDVIIGNPPYIRSRNLPEKDRNYFAQNYKSAYRTYDIYLFFLEQSIRILKDSRHFGFIIPYPFLNQPYAEKLRELILKECHIEEIVDLSNTKVFADAEVVNCIVFCSKGRSKKKSYKSMIINSEIKKEEIDTGQFIKNPDFMYKLEITQVNIPILSKIEKNAIPLGEICYISKGVEVYERDSGKTKDEFIRDSNPDKKYKCYLEAKEMGRYFTTWKGLYLDYQPAKHCSAKFPELFENEKILMKRILGDRGISTTLDAQKLYVENTLICLVLKYKLLNIVKFDPDEINLSKKYSLNFILGVLNSKLMNTYFKIKLGDKLQIYNRAIETLPITKNTTEKKLCDKVASLVDIMLDLNKEVQSAKGSEKERIRKQIDQTDNEIDELVYKLYGLTEKEIKIIEGGIK